MRAAMHRSLDMLDNFSLEMTGKDIPNLDEASTLFPAGTRINVTFLGNEDLPIRLAAARAVLSHGFVPVPHIAARRLASVDELASILGELQESGLSENVFVVGGDPTTPTGPFADSLQVIRSGLFPEFGVREVGISGYPEGHPNISQNTLRSALREKVRALADMGLDGSIITQFGFDVDPVLEWVDEVRHSGIDLPIRVGVPGPAGIKRLLAYASRFGVASSAAIAKKYGLSLTNLLGTAGPDRFLGEIMDRYDESTHQKLHIHFYPFGGLTATGNWINDYLARARQ